MSDAGKKPTEELYDHIKTHLTDVLKEREHRASICFERDSVPGPGYYALNPTYRRSESVRSSFNKAKRFRYSTSLATDSSDILRSNASIELTTAQINPMPAESNRMRSVRSERSGNFFKSVSNFEVKDPSPLRGSFSKAVRNSGLVVNSPSNGPAMYNPMLSQTKVSFSFGKKHHNLSVHASDLPGPGTYKPEDCKGESTHMRSRSTLILRAEHDFVNDLPAVKNRPDGEVYYQYNHFTSFNASKKRGASLGAGTRVDFVNKFQREVPGPGSYPVQKSPLYSNVVYSQQAAHEDRPGLGRPNNYQPPPREENPGPAAYNPVIISKSPSARIGTSKRPSLFGLKKTIEIPVSDQRTKKLGRLEMRLADIALLTDPKPSSKLPCPPAKARKLLFEELAEQNPTPGHIYDLAKYHELGKNSVGGAIDRGDKDVLRKLIKKKMYIPGPATYDLINDGTKITIESKFGQSERASIFVNKDSSKLPGVGDYETGYVLYPPKGGVIPRASKGLNDEKTEVRWKNTQDNFRSEGIYTFLYELEDHVKEFLKKEKRQQESK